VDPFTVAKFGGTSVANYEAMNRCADIIEKNSNTRLIIISACSGVTNLLVQLANGITSSGERANLVSQLLAIHQKVLKQLNQPEAIESEIQKLIDQVATISEQTATTPSNKLTDQLVSCGELLSTHLLTQILIERGNSAVRFDIRKVLRTDNEFGNASPQLEEISSLAQQQLLPLFDKHVVISQGFIGADSAGNTTTLGRGGSDYSAALIAEALNAKSLEIWTDVPGIYTTDPRIAPKASPISEISFIEASEMANFGAKILHPSTLVPAMRKQIPVFVGSSKAPELGGTWVRESVDSAPLFRALALRKNQTMITLHSLNMFHAYGFLAEVFKILAKHQISVDLITTSEVNVSLTLDQTNTSGGAPQLPKEAHQELEQLCRVKVEQGLSLVALVGNKMGDNKGSAKEVFTALENVNIRMICYGASPHNLCFLVDEEDSNDTVKKLHHVLFE
jgi:aspartate kinase